jgi:hypothetical protein
MLWVVVKPLKQNSQWAAVLFAPPYAPSEDQLASLLLIGSSPRRNTNTERSNPLCCNC